MSEDSQVFKNADAGFRKAAAVVFLVYAVLIIGGVNLHKKEETTATICCLKSSSPGVRDSGVLIVLAKLSGGSEIRVEWDNQIPIHKGRRAIIERRTNRITGYVSYSVVGY